MPIKPGFDGDFNHAGPMAARSPRATCRRFRAGRARKLGMESARRMAYLRIETAFLLN